MRKPSRLSVTEKKSVFSSSSGCLCTQVASTSRHCKLPDDCEVSYLEQESVLEGALPASLWCACGSIGIHLRAFTTPAAQCVESLRY